MIPQTFDEWKDCIVNKCKIKLTKQFVETRIKDLEDDTNSNTITFVKIYGISHKNNVIKWFKVLT